MLCWSGRVVTSLHESTPPDHIERPDAVGLPWLVSVRWAGVLAQIGAIAAGAQGLPGRASLPLSSALIAAAIVSNLWLSWRLSRRQPIPMSAGGWLVCTDVVILSWLLHQAGGVLNPVSIFYLVYIVLAALVLDRLWAWGVTTLSIGGYGLLFLSPSAELAAAGSMHPEIAVHVRGMWLAFAGTALLIADRTARSGACDVARASGSRRAPGQSHDTCGRSGSRTEHAAGHHRGGGQGTRGGPDARRCRRRVSDGCPADPG
jgi:hypothetical protein